MLASLAVLIAMGLRKMEQSVKISREVTAYQMKIEDDFRRLLHMGRRKKR
jgi:hypothetical protein